MHGFIRRFYLVIILLLLIAPACRRKIVDTRPRLAQPIVFKINGSSAATKQYAGVLQDQLQAVGIPVQIETLERNTLLDQLRAGQFQIGTGNWIGGNQDPIFLKDLFGTGQAFNRGKYANPELDKLLNEAVATADRARGAELYKQAQEIISREVPMLPLWYQNNIIVTKKNVGNVKPDASGDFSYVAKLTVPASDQPFIIAFEGDPETLDGTRGTDGQSERLRQMIHNSLVKKNEKFDYVGDLAANIQPSADNLTYTFTLRDNVYFHNGKPLTAQDAKYTLDTLLKSDSRKANPFFEGAGKDRKPHVAAIEAPDAKTLVIKLNYVWLQLISNLVAVPIIPEGSAAQQATSPIGTGAFKFVGQDKTQKTVDLEANPSYWDGVPQIKNLRTKVILDANTLQAELKSGRVDLVSNAISLSPDAYNALSKDPNLKVEQFPGANVVYLVFNAQDPVMKDPRLRQAIAYAIDRKAIVSGLLLDQARVANSILPESSWAYFAGTTYEYNPDKARQILDEAGYTAK